MLADIIDFYKLVGKFCKDGGKFARSPLDGSDGLGLRLAGSHSAQPGSVAPACPSTTCHRPREAKQQWRTPRKRSAKPRRRWEKPAGSSFRLRRRATQPARGPRPPPYFQSGCKPIMESSRGTQRHFPPSDYRLIIILAHSDTVQTPCTTIEAIRTIQRRPCKIYHHPCKNYQQACKNLLFLLQNWTKIYIKKTQNYIITIKCLKGEYFSKIQKK